MKIKIWLRRLCLRWTQRNRAVGKLAQEVNLQEKEVFYLVAKVEAEAVDMVRQDILKRRKIAALAQEFHIPEGAVQELVAKIEQDSISLARQIAEQAKREADEKWAREMAKMPSSYPERPSNKNTSGARLSSR